MQASGYIPASHFAFLTRRYDTLVRALGFGRRFRAEMATLLAPQPDERILDVGCGTGTLPVMLAARQPRARVVGVDVDSGILELARKHAADAGVAVDFRVADATRLPFPSHAFDTVTATLMTHHLRTGDKRAMLEEVFRVLAPGGRVFVADFGPVMLPGASVINGLLGLNLAEESGDNFAGRLPSFLRDAGFVDVRTERVFNRWVHFLLARKPAGAGAA